MKAYNLKKSFKAILACLIIFVLAVVPDLSVLAASPRVIDNAGVLSGSESSSLQGKADSISESTGVDIVIVLDDDMNGADAQKFADDAYDNGGYKADGILFFVSPASHDYAFSTSGFGVTAFTDAGLDYIISQIKDKLSSGDYNAAADKFLMLSEDFIKQARNGKPYDKGNLPKAPFAAVKDILIAGVGGFLISLIRASGLKAETKPVKKAVKATSYLVPGSLVMGQGGDVFKFSDTKIVKDNTSSGGSSTHTSSSGNVHGGSSGKF